MSKKAYVAMHQHLMSALFWQGLHEHVAMTCALEAAQALATQLARPYGVRQRKRHCRLPKTLRYSRFAPEARHVLATLDALEEAEREQVRRLFTAPLRVLDYFEGVEGT